MAQTHILRNPLADPRNPTPSAIDSIPPELERELRLYGGLIIQQAGILLNLPQTVMATAATLFQRFYFVTSFMHFGIRDVSSGALFLASKLEEKPARIRDIINVYDYLFQLIEWSRDQVRTPAQADRDAAVLTSKAAREAEAKIESNPLLPSEIKASMLRHLRQKRSTTSPEAVQTSDEFDPEKLKKLDLNNFKYQPMDYFSQKFYDRKEEIVIAEMQILKRLGFHVQVQHPYSAMVNYLQVLNLTDNLEISQQAWGTLNDSLLTPLPALYPPTHLATLSIYLAVKRQGLRLPDAWWELFDVSNEAELVEMSSILTAIYPNPDTAPSKAYEPTSLTIWVRVSHLAVTKEGVRSMIKEGTSRERNP